MARDADALKIQKWAATGDVQDPEDGGLSRATGWDATYSQPGGNLPKREHINQLFRELSALGVELKVHGLLEWDSSIRYVYPAMVMGSDGKPYVSVADSTNVDPTTDTSESSWNLYEAQGDKGNKGDPGPGLEVGLYANRPAAGQGGMLYYSTDTQVLSYDDGTAWQTISETVPAGTIAFFTGACPTGWTEYTAARGRYIVGTPSGGTAEGTVGTALTNVENRAVGQHNHAITDPGHVHESEPIFEATGEGGKVSATGLHDVTAPGANTDSNTTGITVDNDGSVVGTNAPYVQLTVCKKD